MSSTALAELETTTAAQVDAIVNMPKDLAILKMENESIMAMSAAHPRNMKKIKQELIDQLEAFPIFAQAAVYSKPVGKDDDGKAKTVRGLSIRAAEALSEAYGFCRVRVWAEPLGEDAARVTASFTDYQKGRTWEDSGVVSKLYKSKYGGMTRTPEDRFWGVVVKAEASRRIREVILRSVPPGMKMELQAIAEAAMAKTLTPENMQKIVAAFQKLGVNLQQIENYIGKQMTAGWNDSDRVELQGIFNAIKDGETTVAEAFGNGTDEKPKTIDDVVPSAAKKPEQPADTVTLEATASPPGAAQKAASKTQKSLVSVLDQFVAAIADAKTAGDCNTIRRDLEAALHGNKINQEQHDQLRSSVGDRHNDIDAQEGS